MEHMIAMSKTLAAQSQYPSLDSEIQSIDNELAQAVAAAMARRRNGKPVAQELLRIERLSQQRKSLYQRHTKVFG